MKNNKLKFMDFCSGIGGGRLGLTLNGLECVAHSEINENPDKTYRLFYNDDKNYGDLMKINTSSIPDFDIMIAGFPCQTFSIIGRRAGFEDNRGLIIYGLIKILKEKNVPYFIMENVAGLVNHDNGRTLKCILEALKEAGYFVDYNVLNSLNYGVPQMRERIYFVGIRKNIYNNNYKWASPINLPDIKEYLIDTDNKTLNINDITFQKYLNNKYNSGKYNLNDILDIDHLVLDWRQSDLRIYKGKCPTLRTGRHGILYVKDKKLKKLSGYESLLLQGFPKEIAEIAKKSKIADNDILSQAGNAMTVNVIREICKELLISINGEKNTNFNHKTGEQLCMEMI